MPQARPSGALSLSPFFAKKAVCFGNIPASDFLFPLFLGTCLVFLSNQPLSSGWLHHTLQHPQDPSAFASAGHRGSRTQGGIKASAGPHCLQQDGSVTLRHPDEKDSYANFSIRNRGKHCPPASNPSHVSGTWSSHFEQLWRKIVGTFVCLFVLGFFVLYRKCTTRVVPYSQEWSYREINYHLAK